MNALFPEIPAEFVQQVEHVGVFLFALFDFGLEGGLIEIFHVPSTLGEIQFFAGKGEVVLGQRKLFAEGQFFGGNFLSGCGQFF